MRNRSLLYRILLIVGLIVVAIVYLVPTFVTDLPQFWKEYLPVQRIHLGLGSAGRHAPGDDRGCAQGLENSLDHTIEEIKREGKDAKIDIDGVERKDTQHSGSREQRRAARSSLIS